MSFPLASIYRVSVRCLLREQIAAVYRGKVPSRDFTMGQLLTFPSDCFQAAHTTFHHAKGASGNKYTLWNNLHLCLPPDGNFRIEIPVCLGQANCLPGMLVKRPCRF